MNNAEKMVKLAEKLAEKKSKQDAIKAKYDDLKKNKALITAQRLSRIEEYLGLKDES